MVPLVVGAGVEEEEEATGAEEVEGGMTEAEMEVGAGVETGSRRETMEPTAMSW